jgi:hypothetical protein
MNYLTATPRGALIAGTLIAVVIAVAVFVLRAPGWVLVPIFLAGITVYAELGSWVDRRLGRRH